MIHTGHIDMQDNLLIVMAMSRLSTMSANDHCRCAIETSVITVIENWCR